MSQPNIQEELNRAQTEPLLPIEKKLIGWSLGIGIVLLVAWRCSITSHPRHSEDFSRTLASSMRMTGACEHGIAG